MTLPQTGDHVLAAKLLLGGAAALSVLAATVDLLLLIPGDNVGRVRDVGFLWLIGQVGFWLEIDILGSFPQILHQPFQLELASALPWLPLVLLTNLGFVWLLGAISYFILRSAGAAFPTLGLKPAGYWFTRQRCALLIVVACLLPTFIHAYEIMHLEVRLWAMDVPGRGYWAAALFLVPNLLLLLILRLHWRGQVTRFLQGSFFWGAAVLSFALIAGVATVALKEQPAVPTSGALPNILLVSIDTLRADHLHCYGYSRQTSPTIDRLAAEGVLFETVAAPTSWTLPSHVTLLTALAPEQHGVVHHWARLGPESLTLAEVLRAAGYSTAGFVSAPYLGASYGFSQGFDLFDDAIATSGSAARWYDSIITSPRLYQRVGDWLTRWDDEGRERPFFVFLHMWDVHIDYIPPPPYDRLFDPDYRGTITGENLFHSERIHKDMDPLDLRHIVSLYDGEIRYTDHYLGKILQVLERLDGLDNTLVVVTSDHGEEFFEHGRIEHKNALYDEQHLGTVGDALPSQDSRGPARAATGSVDGRGADDFVVGWHSPAQGVWRDRWHGSSRRSGPQPADPG